MTIGASKGIAVCVLCILSSVLRVEANLRVLTFGVPERVPVDAVDESSGNGTDETEDSFTGSGDGLADDTVEGLGVRSLGAHNYVARHIVFPKSTVRRLENDINKTLFNASRTDETGTGNSWSAIPRQPLYTSHRIDIGDPDCPLHAGSVRYNGICYQIFTRGPCGAMQWLILHSNYEPSCEVRPCPQGELMLENKCVRTSAEDTCDANQILYVELTGEVYCDCEPSFVYDRDIQFCLNEHDRGSCAFGSFLELDPQNRLECVPNPCVQDSLLLNPDNRQCYRKEFSGRCATDGVDFILLFHPDGFVTCASIGTRNIFEVPTLDSCSAGSKRDYLGKCQKVFSLRNRPGISLRVPTQFSSQYGYCPNGYIRYPNNSCKKANSLFAA